MYAPDLAPIADSDIFRKLIGWSLGLLLCMCVLVGLQSSVLNWMV